MDLSTFLLAALGLLLLALLAAVAALGFVAYRLATVRAQHAAALEAARRAAEAEHAALLAQRTQALEAQIAAARAETDTVKRESVAYVQAELRERTADLQRAAQAGLEQWRAQELAQARAELAAVAQAEAHTRLAQWQAEHESAIREDAISRSRAVISGKVTEHFVPYLPDFPFNPKDARFIGSPVDLVVFDGLDEGEVRQVVLIEVKTGSSALSGRERRVRDAVQAGRVAWLELRPRLDFTAALTPALDGGLSVELDPPAALRPTQDQPL